MTRELPSFGVVDRIEPRADPVERPEQRVVEPFLHAVGVDDAVHQLLGAGVDPARLVDRARAPGRSASGSNSASRAHAVHLGRRRKDDPLAVAHAGADDRQVGLEVELEHAQRLAHVGGRRGDRDQRQHDVALLDVVLDPFPVDRDVAFEEVKALLRQQVGDAVRLHVHAVDFPVGRGDDPLGQVVADEAVDAEDQDFFHGWEGAVSRRRHEGARTRVRA